MDAIATIRMIRLSLVVLLAVLAVGALSAHEAGATKNNGTNKPSITERVKNFEEDCGALEGEAEVSYSYDRDGKLESANVSCSGGGLGGVNCTYTADTSTCYSEPRGFSPGTTTIRTDDLSIGNTGAQSPESAPDSGAAWAGVGTAGIAEAETTDQPTATTEATPVRTEAAPMTFQIVEDETET